MMSHVRVWSWLSSTVTPTKEELLQNSERSRKRQLPSPPAEHVIMAKRHRKSTVDGLDLTPRPRMALSRFDGAEEEDDRSEISLQSSLASKASKVSRSSSPRKQLANAETQPSGFLIKTLNSISKPPTLDVLVREIMDIMDGNDIVPHGLQSKLSEAERIPSYAFHRRQAPLPYQYPSHEEVREIFDSAEQCENEQDGESSWNMEVHRRVLDHTLRNGPRATRHVDYHYCIAAEIEKDYRPQDAPSKMVDFCIAIKPNDNTVRIIQSDLMFRPGNSINHTDWGILRKHPIAISVETKSDGEAFKPALIQIATWHAAQWRSICWGDKVPNRIEFLAGIIVVGHEWHFVPSLMGADGKPITLKSLPIGGTSTIFGIYKLLAVMQRLKQWVDETFRPAFETDVLGINMESE